MLNHSSAPAEPRQRERLYDEAAHQALAGLWEAADRICGKRLRVLIPVLIEAMERHGHLQLDPVVRRSRLLDISAATIDRLLSSERAATGRVRRRRWGAGSAVRHSVPVRTFAEWGDPPPGYFECDMVEHCGGVKQRGNFVHTLTLTDIHSGWTECAALMVREQSLVVEGISAVARRLPFALRGLDTDNDSAFMNETLQRYCQQQSIEWTRSRAYHKNDQAWVEQKNGAVVRKRFHPPLAPYQRLLASDQVDEAVKRRLREQFVALDPVTLLKTIRDAQQELSALSSRDTGTAASSPAQPEYLSAFATAWHSDYRAPKGRRKTTTKHWWRTRTDPFAESWPLVEEWLTAEPNMAARELLARLSQRLPELYPTGAHLRTLQRRVKAWRAQRARELVFAAAAVEHVAAEPTMVEA